MSSYKVWEINMGVYPRLEFDDITLIYYLGHDFYIFGEFDFHTIPLSVYDVICDITTTSEVTLL